MTDEDRDSFHNLIYLCGDHHTQIDKQEADFSVARLLAIKAGHDALAGVPILPNLVHPDRWLLWLGTLFVLIVYFFPAGIVGSLRQRARKAG